MRAFDEFLVWLEQSDAFRWECVRRDLLDRGVRSLNMYDLLIDFLLMDALDDLAHPPRSVLAILQNRWLSRSFKETVPLRPA